jgi:hypothetical protein
MSICRTNLGSLLSESDSNSTSLMLFVPLRISLALSLNLPPFHSRQHCLPICLLLSKPFPHPFWILEVQSLVHPHLLLE